MRALIDWADLSAGEVLLLARACAVELIAAGIVVETTKPLVRKGQPRRRP